ncbi:unnamed protein product [Amoebophrya sp. A25]|nr:unnamed protein product [Amoebophrya sp. A25]|eukprot:GSA25T00004943001.1
MDETKFVLLRDITRDSSTGLWSFELKLSYQKAYLIRAREGHRLYVLHKISGCKLTMDGDDCGLRGEGKESECHLALKYITCICKREESAFEAKHMHQAFAGAMRRQRRAGTLKLGGTMEEQWMEKFFKYPGFEVTMELDHDDLTLLPLPAFEVGGIIGPLGANLRSFERRHECIVFFNVPPGSNAASSFHCIECSTNSAECCSLPPKELAQLCKQNRHRTETLVIFGTPANRRRAELSLLASLASTQSGNYFEENKDLILRQEGDLKTSCVQLADDEHRILARPEIERQIGLASGCILANIKKLLLASGTEEDLQRFRQYTKLVLKARLASPRTGGRDHQTALSLSVVDEVLTRTDATAIEVPHDRGSWKDYCAIMCSVEGAFPVLCFGIRDTDMSDGVNGGEVEKSDATSAPPTHVAVYGSETARRRACLRLQGFIESRISADFYSHQWDTSIDIEAEEAQEQEDEEQTETSAKSEWGCNVRIVEKARFFKNYKALEVLCAASGCEVQLFADRKLVLGGSRAQRKAASRYVDWYIKACAADERESTLLNVDTKGHDDVLVLDGLNIEDALCRKVERNSGCLIIRGYPKTKSSKKNGNNCSSAEEQHGAQGSKEKPPEMVCKKEAERLGLGSPCVYIFSQEEGHLFGGEGRNRAWQMLLESCLQDGSSSRKGRGDTGGPKKHGSTKYRPRSREGRSRSPPRRIESSRHGGGASSKDRSKSKRERSREQARNTGRGSGRTNQMPTTSSSFGHAPREDRALLLSRLEEESRSKAAEIEYLRSLVFPSGGAAHSLALLGGASCMSPLGLQSDGTSSLLTRNGASTSPLDEYYRGLLRLQLLGSGGLTSGGLGPFGAAALGPFGGTGGLGSYRGGLNSSNTPGLGDHFGLSLGSQNFGNKRPRGLPTPQANDHAFGLPLGTPTSNSSRSLAETSADSLTQVKRSKAYDSPREADTRKRRRQNSRKRSKSKDDYVPPVIRTRTPSESSRSRIVLRANSRARAGRRASAPPPRPSASPSRRPLSRPWPSGSPPPRGSPVGGRRPSASPRGSPRRPSASRRPRPSASPSRRSARRSIPSA